MGYSFEEKIRYNKERAKSGDLFSKGYIKGVSCYQSYAKEDERGKKAVKNEIALHKRLSKYRDMCTEDVKGFLCGVRDAANERKARQKR